MQVQSQKELRLLKAPFSLLPPESCVNPPNSGLGRLRQRKNSGFPCEHQIIQHTGQDPKLAVNS